MLLTCPTSAAHAVGTLFLLALAGLSGPAQGVAVASEASRGFREASRHVHLDFHTSEFVDSIGVDFSKEQFQEALRVGHVNAINVFAKGHHSWFYYPTEVGRRHPNFEFDLLGQVIEACREADVRAFAYFTVGWSASDATDHPEWVALQRDGTSEFLEAAEAMPDRKHPGGWAYLEPSGPYADAILAQVEELITMYPDLDGVWFDVFEAHRPNSNAWSMSDYAAVRRRAVERYHDFTRRANAVVNEHLPEGTTYYTGTTATYFDEDLALFKDTLFAANAKHDLEDLPTAWGGYDIFPWRSKYFANTGKPTVAMSGKFHRAWGESGGFKDPDAIKYEAATMVAFGAACNFGDQLHPRGETDVSTIENYGVDARHVARTGLSVSEDIEDVNGITQILLGEQVSFNVVNTLDDWADGDVLVLTSGGVLAADYRRVRDFVARGGKVLSFGRGFLAADGTPLVDVGAELAGGPDYDVDYTVVGEEVARDMVASPYLTYAAAIRLSPKPGSRGLASIREPYFSRTLARYSSHNNTPYRTDPAEHPAVVERADGKAIAIAHDLDQQYAREGMRLHRTQFANALARLRDRPMVTADLQSMGRLNLLHQPERNRYVAHLTYASPIQHGNVRVVVEDIVPEMRGVELTRDGERVNLVIENLNMHTAVVVEY